MTHDQFIAKLIEMGYEHFSPSNTTIRYQRFDKEDKTIIIQEWSDYTNVYYEYNDNDINYECNQHRIKNYQDVYDNIIKFERKLGI